MWKHHIKVLSPEVWYNVVFDDYVKFHDHLDSFDKWIFTRFLPKDKKDLNIIDLGAWDWRLYKYTKNLSIKNYVVCDISTKLLERHPWKVKKVVCNLEDELPFESEYFDLALSFFVLEHIENLENFFEEVYRILKPGGDWIVWYFIQRKAFTFRKPFQFRIKMFNYRFEEIEKIATKIWFWIHDLPCYEGNDLIGWVMVLSK